MKNRAVRIALFLLVVLAFGAAGYELTLLDRQATATRDAARAFEEKARQVEAAVRELRAAQFAYVATGQGFAFWTARVGTLLPAIGADLQKLCSMATDGTATGLKPGGPTCPFVSAALDDLATVQRIDTSVQGYLREDQRLLASDLVFSDLREADQTLAARIEEARKHQAAADDAAANTVRRKQIATAGGAAVFAVLILLLLVPAGRTLAEDKSGTVPDSRLQAPGVIGLRPEPAAHGSSPEGEPMPGAWSPEPEVRRASSATVESAAANIPHPVDLSGAAALCTDFARLREPTELPALLERAAALLHAVGVVVWVADASSGELRPALSHGYPPQALARIHGVSKDDDNATACAYRERRLRVVEGDAQSNGAIAAPLLAPDGCVGVMAAEIREGQERDEGIQSVAAIIAAQLATLVTPQAAATESSK